MFALLFGLSVFGAVTPGCALQDRKTRGPQTACILPGPQERTLSGHWPLTPVPIAVQQGQFSDAEKAAISSAAATWNEFFAVSIGAPALDYLENGRLRESATFATTLNCQSNWAYEGRKFVRTMVIYKIRSGWPSERGTSVIAVNNLCDNDRAMPETLLTNGSIELNFQHFWGTGQEHPDIQTIVLHELGHLLGLKHSCTYNEANIPNCRFSPDAYSQAVMRPSFGFLADGKGEVVRDLTENDESRMNCLYK